jgi:3-methyladenine DNA glycosylase AlkD
MEYNELIKKLKSLSNPKNLAGMARFGINTKNTLGIPIPKLRKLAKQIGKNHELALKLYDSGIHEARILACFIADPKLATEKQLEKWVKKLDSWDDCDQCCSAFFDKTKFAYKKAIEWTKRKEEFVKRAGFAVMATLAVHDKKAGDSDFIKFFPRIEKESIDERNFVRKAVNWALRQIGKRNKNLNKEAIGLANKILKKNSKCAKWIANDAIRELTAKKFV